MLQQTSKFTSRPYVDPPDLDDNFGNRLEVQTPQEVVDQVVAFVRKAYADLGVLADTYLVEVGTRKLLAILERGGTLDEARRIVEWARHKIADGSQFVGYSDLGYPFGDKYQINIAMAGRHRELMAKLERRRQEVAR
jgi:hypothetical protein